MNGKKNPSIFTLSFNMRNPRHVLAAKTLNAMGRKKAEFLSALIEAAAKHPEAFGFICDTASGGKGREECAMDINDAAFLTSMVEGSGFRRVNQSHGKGRPLAADRAPDMGPPDGQMQERNAQADIDGGQGRKDPGTNETAGADVEDPILGEIPEELKGSLLSNLKFFDGLGDED